jgi:hypothetical protein
MTPFSGALPVGRYAWAAISPALAVAGVIITRAAHRRLTGSGRLDGVRRPEKGTGGATGAARLACRPRVPSRRHLDSRGASWLGRRRLVWCRRLGLDNGGAGPFRPCFASCRGRAKGLREGMPR